MQVVAFPPSCSSRVYTPDDGAMVCFNPTGEHMFVCDIKADGHHAAAWYQGSNDASGASKHNYDGNGTCLDVNFDMPEDTSIRYRAINYEDTTVLSVSGMTGWISANG